MIIHLLFMKNMSISKSISTQHFKIVFLFERERERGGRHILHPLGHTIASPGESQVPESSSSSLRGWQGIKDLGCLVVLSQACWQQARLKVEQPGLKPVLMWKAHITGSASCAVFHYGTAGVSELSWFLGETVDVVGD